MNISHLSIALISYLTGAVVVFAYVNRNRYLDLAFASAAIFAFATAMLFSGFGILPVVSGFLLSMSTGLMVIAVLLLVARLAKNAYGYMIKYIERRRRIR